MESYNHEEEISLQELVNIIKPYLRHVVMISIMFAVISLLVTKFLVKPTYQSSATFIVNNRRDEMNQAISNDELSSARNLASVYSIIIQSDAITKPVVVNNQFDITAEELSQKISVTTVDGTQVIKMSVKDQNPELAQLYASKIIEVAPGVINDLVGVGDLKVVAQPKIPDSPSAPNVKVNTLVAGMLGFMLSLGYILVGYFTDNTFKSVEEVEQHLEIPILTVIPNVDNTFAEELL